MPVVLRVGGFTFNMFGGDHDPPHVHVWQAGAKVTIDIETERVRRPVRMSAINVWRAQRLVREYREALLSAWHAIKAEERDR